MARFAGIGFFGFVLLALWIYCIFDVIASEESLVRNLPKTLWLILVIFVPTVGAIAWLALGRPMYAGFRPGDTRTRSPQSLRGPEDDTTWLPGSRAIGPSEAASSESARERRLREREADLERRERELEQRERGDTDSDS